MKKIVWFVGLLLPFAGYCQTKTVNGFAPAVADKIIEITEANLYNPELVNDNAWVAFKGKVKEFTDTVTSVYSFRRSFNQEVGQLPFTHYFLMRKKSGQSLPQESGVRTQSNFIISEVDDNTVLLKARSFATGKEEIEPVIAELKNRHFNTLILDMRGNGGGTIASALPLAQYLLSDTVYGGVFLTQKYFKRHRTLPTVEEYKNFVPFNQASFALIIAGIHSTEGLCLVIPPDPESFTGNLYVLVDGGTASTCEPLAYSLQYYKRGVLVGETTAGAMMNGEIFNISDELDLFVPTADYYTVDGKKLDKVGVEPDIKVASDKALDKVKELLLIN